MITRPRGRWGGSFHLYPPATVAKEMKQGWRGLRSKGRAEPFRSRAAPPLSWFFFFLFFFFFFSPWANIDAPERTKAKPPFSLREACASCSRGTPNRGGFRFRNG